VERTASKVSCHVITLNKARSTPARLQRISINLSAKILNGFTKVMPLKSLDKLYETSVNIFNNLVINSF
jgi:hypothetical protein